MQHTESKNHGSYAHPVIDGAEICDAPFDETKARNLKSYNSDHKISKRAGFTRLDNDIERTL